MTTPAAPADGGSGTITRGAVLAAAHAPNKAALLDGVAETVLAQLHVDSAAAPRQLARTVRPGSGASSGDTLARGVSPQSVRSQNALCP